MMDDDFIPLEKAAEQLKVTRATMWRRAREWGLTIYHNPLDKRQRLLKWSEIGQAMRPQPIARKAPDATLDVSGDAGITTEAP